MIKILRFSRRIPRIRPNYGWPRRCVLFVSEFDLLTYATSSRWSKSGLYGQWICKVTFSGTVHT